MGKNEAEARHAALYQDPDSQGLYPASATAVIPRPPGRGLQNKKGPPTSTSLPVHEVIQPLAPSIEPQVSRLDLECVGLLCVHFTRIYLHILFPPNQQFLEICLMRFLCLFLLVRVLLAQISFSATMLTFLR